MLKEKKGPRLLPKSYTEHLDGTHAQSWLLVVADRSRRTSVGMAPRYVRFKREEERNRARARATLRVQRDCNIHANSILRPARLQPLNR